MAPLLGTEGLSGGDINETPTGSGNASKAEGKKAASTVAKVSPLRAMGKGALRVLGPIGWVAAAYSAMRGLGLVDHNRTTSTRRSFGEISLESMIRTLETAEVDVEMARMPIFQELANAQRQMEMQQRIAQIGGDRALNMAIRTRSPKLIEMAQAGRTNVGDVMDTVLARTGRRVIPSGLVPEEEF